MTSISTISSSLLATSPTDEQLSKLTAGDGATNSPGATYSTSGSVSQGSDDGLLVNTTA